MDSLRFYADISAVGAFVVTLIASGIGIWGYLSFRRAWSGKKSALESYLKRQKQTDSSDDKGQRTTLHLVRHVGLTEEEILKISFESQHINRLVRADAQNVADSLLFEYVD